MVHSPYTVLCTGINDRVWDVLKEKGGEELIQLA